MPTPTAILRAASLLPTRPTRVWTGRRPARGFTLLHLLGVIAVTGALSAVVAPSLFPGHP